MSAFTDWLLAELRVPTAAHSQETDESKARPWWQVMCLTGVDYFSSLGYAPGIAFLAAGDLSPMATLVLVLVTLFAALPAYRRVAKASPNGQGSIAMMERLFPQWLGKIFILVLLGFATTDFIITITLSAADGAAHLIHNPYYPREYASQFWVTIAILAVLGGIFLRGFREAITIAVVLVGIYLALNAVVVFVAVGTVIAHPSLIAEWKDRIFQAHGSLTAMIGISLLLFPRLALGLSGFETGVAVMPLIKAKDEEERVRNARFLLVTAALIMSFFLIGTSITTTLLIPLKEFKEGGHANGRAVAWLAHRYLGDGFGTVYDFSTILILGFAGASAMAGLLNLIPRYLPRFGMAPDWARASRPLVFVFFAISLVVTWAFHADVDAQGGAYATGVLVLMTSAAVAVFLSVRNTGMAWLFGPIAAVFVYTTGVNMYERPEGIKISSIFIGCIMFTSFLSRALRSTELRIGKIDFDPPAMAIVHECREGRVRLVARSLTGGTIQDYDHLERCIRNAHDIPENQKLIFLEAESTDSSEFDVDLCVNGKMEGKYQVLRTCTPAVPNSFAAILMEITRITGTRAHIYFTWPEGNPLLLILRFVFLGDGDTAPLTREILRKAIKDPDQRPLVHVV